MGIRTEHHVNLVLGGIEIVEQPLRVQSAASAGDGNKYSQAGWSVKTGKLWGHYTDSASRKHITRYSISERLTNSALCSESVRCFGTLKNAVQIFLTLALLVLLMAGCK